MRTNRTATRQLRLSFSSASGWAYLGCSLLIAGSPQSSAAQSTPPARSDAWQAVDCTTFKLEGMPDHADCGYVTVPLRHLQPNGPTIQLATVIVRSTDPNRAPEPLFIAQGGPGGSSIETYAGALATVAELNPAPNRDLVIWDQRGTLWSKPALLCPEVAAADLAAAQEGRRS